MKVKLAYINHSRCQETDGGLYVFIPEDWDKDKLRKVVSKCVKEHIRAAEDWKENSNAPNNWRNYSKPDYAKYPDLTVSQVQAKWKEMEKEYKAWEKAREPSKLSFSKRLKQEGVLCLYDVEAQYEVYAEWGHHHGLGLSYDHPHVQQDMVSPDRVSVDWDGTVEISEY